MFDFITIKEVKSNIGMWCKELRKAEKLSQEDLAGQLGLSRLTISNLEKGENFTIETLLKVIQFFGQLNAFNDFVKNNTNTNESLY